MIYKIGSKGPEVKQIQKALNIEADGIFGQMTEQAVKDFQEANGLDIDGIVGPHTWAILFNDDLMLDKSRRKIRKIILHCSATIEGKDYTVEQIRQWHLKRGFNDIGYHYVIYRDGTIHNGRHVDQSGAHTLAHNHDSIGICYIGGLDANSKPKDTRTDKQKESMYKLIDKLLKLYNLTINDVYGHYQFQNKACPCFKIETFRKEFNEYLS